MDKNMNNLFENVKKMVDNGNIPPELQQMIKNLQYQQSNDAQEQKNSFQSSVHQSNYTTQNSSRNPNYNSENNNLDINAIMSQIPPDMLNNLTSMLNSNGANKNTSNSNINSQNNFNLDINTIMKMKSIMEKMNHNDDPRANLLYSLKPYLRDSKKDKVDQYVNMLNITKIAEFMNNNENDTKK